MTAEAAIGRPVAVFFGGVVPADPSEWHLAHEIGRALGKAGYTLRHGGYNGLMEQAARGAAAYGGDIVAVTLDRVEWGPFNPHVTHVMSAPDMGARLMTFLRDADLVVAMVGGVGTLHELAAAIWYAGNIRPVPVWLVGHRAARLAEHLRRDSWLFESPTRPLGFLRVLVDSDAIDEALTGLVGASTTKGWWG
jgi:uncharacterized protein (TIGR00725 family)